MNIDIRKLSPDLAEDYVHFFDITPHDDYTQESKCYCVCWCNDDYTGKDFSTPEKRREYAIRYVKGNNIQGYLAYCDDEVIGWCNANTKSDCLKCASWQRFMGTIPVEDSGSGGKVKSIFCYVIAPEWQRKGIATRLLERVCQNAAQDGFDFVEAYPKGSFISTSRDFMGPAEMYRKNGFTVYHETEKRLVMRKRLK